MCIERKAELPAHKRREVARITGLRWSSAASPRPLTLHLFHLPPLPSTPYHTMSTSQLPQGVKINGASLPPPSRSRARQHRRPLAAISASARRALLAFRAGVGLAGLARGQLIGLHGAVHGGCRARGWRGWRGASLERGRKGAQLAGTTRAALAAPQAAIFQCLKDSTLTRLAPASLTTAGPVEGEPPLLPAPRRRLSSAVPRALRSRPRHPPPPSPAVAATAHRVLTPRCTRNRPPQGPPHARRPRVPRRPAPLVQPDPQAAPPPPPAPPGPVRCRRPPRLPRRDRARPQRPDLEGPAAHARPRGPPRRDHGPGRPQDGHQVRPPPSRPDESSLTRRPALQRAQLGRRHLHGRLRGCVSLPPSRRSSSSPADSLAPRPRRLELADLAQQHGRPGQHVRRRAPQDRLHRPERQGVQAQRQDRDPPRPVRPPPLAVGRSRALADEPVAVARSARGWHLDEPHITVDGQPMSGSMFDFGMYFFHSAKEALARGSGPYF